MSCISVQNLSLSFGEKTLFDNVSFDVYEKDKIGFVGANGVGKTSLFKILTGEYQPTSGAAFLGKNVKLGYMEQHTCSENKTVYEELISVFDDLIKLERYCFTPNRRAIARAYSKAGYAQRAVHGKRRLNL